ncbi:MAG TPA: lipoate--protein ligase [Bacteroidales bacterium]|nr:lipoate--protein ligase [Bacteroidales bacterium]
MNSESADPFFNLAVEEVLLKNDSRDFIFFYINNPSVIIGKHQTAHKEADTKFTLENNIPVIRRISGGGTVFHDRGNLNFSFISGSETGKQVDFRKYTTPIIKFLNTLGIDARFEGKNDIRVNGLKISGNAEHVHRQRVLHHGTLLFDSSLNELRNAIRKDTSCYSSRSVDSNPSRVTNLCEMLPGIISIAEFRQQLVNFLLEESIDMHPYYLEEVHQEKAIKLVKEKYHSWEWNYAYGPEYEFRKNFIFNGEEQYCHLFVKDGMIRECNIVGSPLLSGVAEELKGCRHMPGDLSDAINKSGPELCDLDIFSFF